MYSLSDKSCSRVIHFAKSVNKLWTRIRCQDCVSSYDVRSSLKELKRTAAVNKLPVDVSRIIPGDWGKVEPGWLARPLLRLHRKVRRAEAGFTSSSGGVRAPSVNAKKELGSEERLETVPS